VQPLISVETNEPASKSAATTEELSLSWQDGYDARAIANWVLKCAVAKNMSLTNLQLQKILFFAHGSYVVRFKAPLVMNRFEAWEHGPVIPELYHALKQHGDRPIRSPVTRYDLESSVDVIVTANFTDQVREHLAEMLLFYGRMDPWALVKLSHLPSGPWAKTLERSKGSANFSLVIDPQLIDEFFDNPGYNWQ
jgi:uncharacterized phage-associated protein